MVPASFLLSYHSFYGFGSTLTPASTKSAIVSSCAAANSGEDVCSPARPLKMKTNAAPMFSYCVLSMPSCFIFSRIALRRWAVNCVITGTG